MLAGVALQVGAATTPVLQADNVPGYTGVLANHANFTLYVLSVEKGARLDAKSTQGWTPWTIANGVFYSLFFKEQRATADLLAQLMAERGLSTAGMAATGTMAGARAPRMSSCRKRVISFASI